MIDIRPTTPEEYRAASATVCQALLQAPPDDESFEKSRASWADSASLTAWDGAQCVGHAAAYPFETVVPGGARLATAGVSRVGVLSTHRRQGVASTLLRQVLSAAHERGQVLASLRASEAVIYGRYGFGVAGDAAEVTVDPTAARPITGAAPGSMRLLAPDEIVGTIGPLYDVIAASPGVIRRPDWMWHRYFDGALKPGGDAEFVAVHRGADGHDDGFVHYGVKWRTATGTVPIGEGEVHDLFGASPAVELALWSYVCDIDLVRTWTAEERPLDDPLRLAAHDRRAFVVRLVWDEQWLRLLDVDAALSARSYGDAVDGVTVAVRDELFPANTGMWRIEPKGAARIEVDAGDADLAVDVATLAATYLGGTRWTELAAVGQVAVRNPSVLALADTLFATARAPFCGSFY